MARTSRLRPAKLGNKLKHLRLKAGLTQAEMADKVKVDGEGIYPASISKYESGHREPSLAVLLRYARLASVPMEVLVDDRMKFK